MALRLSFIGPPHSGKRTQALALRQNGFACAFSADLRRAAGGDEADGAALLEAAWRGPEQSGPPLPPIEAPHRATSGSDPAKGGEPLEAVRAFFNQHAGRAIVLVGYPATVEQAAQLASLGLDAAVFFDASDETMLRRVGNCLIGPGGHVQPPSAPALPSVIEDAETYKQRLAAYRQGEAPLRAFYTRAGIAHSVLAGYPQATVRAQIADLIADLYVGRARRTAAPG